MGTICDFPFLRVPKSALVGAALVVQCALAVSVVGDEVRKLEQYLSRSLTLPENASVEGIGQCLRTALGSAFSVEVDTTAFARVGRSTSESLRNPAKSMSLGECVLRDCRKHSIDFSVTESTIRLIPRTYRVMSYRVYDLSGFDRDAQVFLKSLFYALGDGDAWEHAGGPAEIVSIEPGVLIIRQMMSDHLRIREVLSVFGQSQ